MKFTYELIGIACALAAIVVGIFGMPEVMAVAAILALAFLFFANADRVARVKASATGFEAETRAILEEARATLEQVRQVAKIAVQASLSVVMRTGRMGGFYFDEKERVRDASQKALESLGVPKKEQEEIFNEWHSVNRFDYAHILLGRYKIPKEVYGNNELTAEWERLRKTSFLSNPSSNIVEAFLIKAGMMNDERRELLDDYRHYEKYGLHRRPSVWKKLHDHED